jgi:hypothetical protein
MNELVEMFERKGVRDPKSQEFVNKSRVASYINGRARVPDWFLEGVRIVVGLPDTWTGLPKKEKMPHAMTSSDFGHHAVPFVAQSEILLPLVTFGWEGPTLKIPLVTEGVAIRMESLQARPVISPGDVVVIDPSIRAITLDRVFALADSNGKLSLGKSTEADGEIAFAQPKNKPNLEPPEFQVVGAVVAVLFDFDGSADADHIFNSKGVRIPNW